MTMIHPLYSTQISTTITMDYPRNLATYSSFYTRSNPFNPPTHPPLSHLIPSPSPCSTLYPSHPSIPRLSLPPYPYPYPAYLCTKFTPPTPPYPAYPFLNSPPPLTLSPYPVLNLHPRGLPAKREQCVTSARRHPLQSYRWGVNLSD